MNHKIKIETQLDAPLFGKLSRYLNWQKLRPLALFMLAMILLSVLFLFFQHPLEEALVKLMSYAIPAAIIGLIWWVILRYSTKKGFENNPMIGEPIVYTFSKKEIHIKGESFESKMGWDKLHRVEETPDFMLIYQTKMLANGLPKTQISEQDLIALRTLIHEIDGLESKLM